MSMSMPQPEKKEYKPSFKRKLYKFFGTVVRWFWFLIVAVVIVQIIFIVTKVVAQRPSERMCWDYSQCFEYCATFSGAQCIAPQQKDTSDLKSSWKLLITGKRNLLEVLNENQKYCACEYETSDGSRLDTFFEFYADPITDY